MTSGYWTLEETAVLREMVKQGCRTAEIAAKLKRPTKSVTERKRRLGLTTNIQNPWTQKDEDTLRELAAAGKSLKEIAKVLHRAPATCRAKRTELGLSAPTPSVWTREDYDKLTELVEAGKSKREIAKIMGRSEQAVNLRCYMIDAKAPGRKEREEPEEPRGTICWRCNKACIRGCSWAARFEPVPGWDAKPNGRSYHVDACPEFEPDRPKEWRSKWIMSNT